MIILARNMMTSAMDVNSNGVMHSMIWLNLRADVNGPIKKQ